MEQIADILRHLADNPEALAAILSAAAAAADAPGTFLTTRELARRIGYSPQTIRNGLCSRGHFYGLVPERLPTGELRWPADSVARLMAAGRIRTPAPSRRRRGVA
jgi:predicted transcriptional regulator